MSDPRYSLLQPARWPPWLLLLAGTLLVAAALLTPAVWWTPLSVALAVFTLGLLLLLTWMTRNLRSAVRAQTRALAHSNTRLTREMQLKDDYTKALQQNDQKLQMALQVSALAVWDWDIAHRKLQITGPHNGFGQRSQGQLLPLYEYVHPEDTDRVRRALLAHVRGRSRKLSVRYRNREEPPRWLEDTGRAIAFDHRQRPSRLLGTRRDITAEVAHQQELALAANLFSGNRDPILVLDRAFRVSSVNPAFAEMLQRSPEEWQTRFWPECSHSELTHAVIRRLTEQGHWEGELLEQRGDGLAFPLHISFRTVMDNGVVSRYLGFCRDLSHDRPSRQTLLGAHRDALTGLPNRGYFHQQLDYYRRMERLPAHQVAVGLLNVDRFRQLNDQFGRAAGDTLLQDIAARLSQYGAPLMMVSRLGADEFGLLFSHFETPARLHHLTAQIIADIHRPILLEQDEILATASLGLIMLTRDNVHDCMTAASMALQRARRRGGNQVVDPDSATAHGKPDKDTARRALERLLAQLEQPLRFRPQLCAGRGTLAGIRVSNVLDYAELGDVQVEPLYALAQEKQLEERLYSQLLKEACACHQRCRRQGAADNIMLSFPVSPRLILNEHLRTLTEAVLEPLGMVPQQLELSFSARILRHDRTLILAQLNALHRAGFRIMLEDVEAWPITLAQLGQLPINALRVKQPVPERRPTADRTVKLAPTTALLAHYCLQFGWDLCLSRLDGQAQQQAAQRLPEDLRPRSRLEGDALSHALNEQQLLTFVHYQSAMLLPTSQLH